MPGISWKCPYCGGQMVVTELECVSCGAEVSGQFPPCRFCNLPEGELNFLLAFLASRGNIKSMEKMLGISYPTVRSRMDGLLTSLNLTSDFHPRPSATDILERLDRGEISVSEALKLLQGKGKTASPRKTRPAKPSGKESSGKEMPSDSVVRRKKEKK
jgi:hypothetical protein